MSAEDRVVYWQRRARDAERCLEYEKEHNESTLRWAHTSFSEARRAYDRCTFLYGLAVKHGATKEELAQAWPPAASPSLPTDRLGDGGDSGDSSPPGLSP
jgi:hypothetical protein